MPNVELSEERLQFKKLAKEFAEGEILPQAAHLDASREFPREIIEKAWEIGLINYSIPETLGGLELQLLDACLILEELAGGCSGIAAAFEASTIAQLPILRWGSDEQKERFIAPFTEKPLLAGFGTWDKQVNRIRIDQKKGEYFLDGEHLSIINAGQASWYLVPTWHQEELLAILIPDRMPGLLIEDRSESLGRRAQMTRAIKFDNLKLSEEHIIRLGKGDTSEYSEIDLFFGSVDTLICAGVLGLASRSVAHAVDYAKQRQTFGRPISQHQAIAFMIADMARDLETGRLLCYQAAHLLDNGFPARLEAASARAFAVSAGMRITTDAVQVYGGYGYSREYPVEKLMRDAMQYRVMLGSSHHGGVSVARQLLRLNS